MLPSDVLPIATLFATVLPLPSFLPAGAAFDALALSSVRAVSELPAACPDEMLLVDGDFCPALDYQCDRFVDDVSPSCAEYARKPACRYNSQSKRFCIDRHEWPNRARERPRVFVSWNDATELCQAAGKRLCHRSEWTLACEGPKHAPYPYGWQRMPSPCNVSRPSIEFDADDLINPRTRAAELERLWQGDPIGSHPDCVSPFGAYDMVGNVDEWTDNREEGNKEQPATLNGGYWGQVRNTCRLTTKTHGPEFHFYQIGFRCCADPGDGILPAADPPRLPQWQLDERAGPDGWPVVTPEERAEVESTRG